MIVLLGAATTYYDYKEGKIPNKWIITALIYALIVNLAFMVILPRTGQHIRQEYFIELLITVLLSLIVGFMMWWIGLWTAGDAKLFTAFSALVPLTVYKYGYIYYLASSNILINTFVPFFIVYATIILTKTTVKQKWEYLKKSLDPKIMIFMFLFLFGFIWPLNIIFGVLGISGNYFISIFLLFIMLVIVEKIFKDKSLWAFISLTVLRVIFDDSSFSISSWINLLVIFISFIFLRYFILYLGYEYLTRFVDIILLKKGMVPAEAVYKEKDKFHKFPILHFSLISYLQERIKKRKYLFEPTAEGLTHEDVQLLKKLEKKLGFEHLRIYKTISFAPYMFIGVILTILFHGNMFIAIVSLW